MGSIVKGIASAFGGRGRRREQKAANKEFDQRKDALGNMAATEREKFIDTLIKIKNNLSHLND